MGYEAILSTGEVIAPAVDFLDKQITAAQANKLYRGVTGTCSHCLALRRSLQGTDNITILAALSQDDLPVHYVSAVLSGERVDRIMHFAHRAGYWTDATSCRICSDSRLVYHGAAVQVIARWARKQWPGSTVQAELRISAKGAPPTSFRPDIAVHDATGKPIACIEYQRSGENFLDFQKRDEVRLTEFPQVLWFFDRGVYHRSTQHRNYLHDAGRQFFKTWTDPQTLQLNYDEGAPHKAKAPATPQYKELDPCSEASLIRGLERHDVSRSGPLAPDTNLDLKRAEPERQSQLGGKGSVASRSGAVIRTGISQSSLAPTSQHLLKTPIQRIMDAKRNGRKVDKYDRIKHALLQGLRTPLEIQRWDHSQGFGMLLSLRDIEKVLRRTW